MEKTKIIIFDMDGVIFDSVRLTYTYVKKKIPYLPWRVYQRIFDKLGFLRLMKALGRLVPRRVTRNNIVNKDAYTVEKLECRLIDGVDSLLEKLSKSYVLALNTNASNRNSGPLLKKYKIESLFTFIETRDTGATKNTRSLSMLDRAGLRPEDAIFITDSKRDVLHAKELGIKSIGVLTGMHERRHFEEKDVADFVFAVTSNSEELYLAIENYFKKNEEG